MRLSTCVFVSVGLISFAQSMAQEDFNQAGSSWNPTIYQDRWPRTGAFWRSPFAGAPCLPANPAFPIAQGGDKEGAYSSPVTQACEAYALVNTVPAHLVTNTRTEGFVHLCPAPGSNSRATVGYTARTILSAGANPQPIASYMAVLSAPPGTTDVYLLILEDADGCLDTGPVDGIIDGSDILNVIGPIGTTAFNYHLSFEVVGNTLTASARRATLAAGALVLDPPVTITATDNTIPAGFNGVVGYAPHNNRVFWDDVTVTVQGVGPIGGGGNGNCPCDWDANGQVNSADYFGFLTSIFSNDPAADINGDERVDSRDYFDFLTCFFTGC